MWTCPQCQTPVDDDFEVCWQCGTSILGEADPDFVTADDSPPISDPNDHLRFPVDPGALDDDLPAPPLDLVACFITESQTRATLLSQSLLASGIPSSLDRFLRAATTSTANPFRILIRSSDLPRALPLIEEFQSRHHDHGSPDR